MPAPSPGQHPWADDLNGYLAILEAAGVTAQTTADTAVGLADAAGADATDALADAAAAQGTATTALGNAATALAAAQASVQPARTITAGTGLTGGGDLSANRTLAVSYGTGAGTAAQGNDTRITGAVQSTRQVISGTGLTGGGDLSADRTLVVAYGTSGTTAAVGNDSRLSNARTPTDHDHSVATTQGGFTAVPRAKITRASTTFTAATNTAQTFNWDAQTFSSGGGPTWTSGANFTLPAINADWDIKLKAVFQNAGTNGGLRIVQLFRVGDDQLVCEGNGCGPGASATDWVVVNATELYRGAASQAFYGKVKQISGSLMTIAEVTVTFTLVART